MKSYFTAALGLVILASCAEQTSTTSSGQPAEEAIARILVIEEHPFDLEASLENPDGINLANTLRFLASRDTDRINTNFDELKSIVTVIRGPVPAGTRVTMKYRQFVSGEQYEYETVTEIPEVINTEPAIIVNSYRASRSAKVRVRAYIGGDLIAERKFEAKGKAHSFGGEWSTKAGDRRLDADELRELIVGKKLRIGPGGVLSYAVNGDYQFNTSDRDRGTYMIRDDGFVCVEFTNVHKRCDIYVWDDRGNLYLVNKKSARYRAKIDG